MENTQEHNQDLPFNPDTIIARLSRKQNEAYRNVFLRYVLEQKYGVNLGGQSHFLTPFYSKIISGQSLTYSDIDLINNHISSHEWYVYQLPALDELESLYLLSRKLHKINPDNLYLDHRKLFRSLFKDLRIFFGLTNDQAGYLEDILEQNGIKIDRFRFPRNQARIKFTRKHMSH